MLTKNTTELFCPFIGRPHHSFSLCFAPLKSCYLCASLGCNDSDQLPPLLSNLPILLTALGITSTGPSTSDLSPDRGDSILPRTRNHTSRSVPGFSAVDPREFTFRSPSRTQLRVPATVELPPPVQLLPERSPLQPSLFGTFGHHSDHTHYFYTHTHTHTPLQLPRHRTHTF
jgi:hypothetical protein